MTEDAKKKKKKVVSSVTAGMGNPVLGIKQFNKELGDGLTDENKECDVCPTTPDTITDVTATSVEGGSLGGDNSAG